MGNIQLKIEIIDDIKLGEKIWSEMSPKKSIYDQWDFRFCFYKQNKFPINFIIGKYKNKNIALLPLQFNTEKNCMEFFAEDYVDNNKIFIDQEFKKFTPLFYKSIKDKICFSNLAEDPYIKDRQQFDHFIYTLFLKNIKNNAEFIENFFIGSNSHKKKLKGELKRFSEKNSIKVLKNNFNDIEIFFKYKIKHFGSNTCFNDKEERMAFADLLSLDYDFHMFTFIVNEIKAGVTVAILFKGQYVFLQSACDQELFPSITKYAFMKNIDMAIDLGAKIFDTSRGGENWKERWKFKKIPQYSFKI